MLDSPEGGVEQTVCLGDRRATRHGGYVNTLSRQIQMAANLFTGYL